MKNHHFPLKKQLIKLYLLNIFAVRRMPCSNSDSFRCTSLQRALSLSESMYSFYMKKLWYFGINQNRNSPFFEDLEHMVPP